MKKIITIILTVVILAAVGALVAFLVIRNTPQGESITESVKNFFPFGRAPTNTQTGTENTTENGQVENEEQTNRPVVIPRLRKITDNPVSGYTVLTGKSTTTGEIVRYMERSNGNVFEATTNSLETKRISNKTVPKVYEAVWSPTGSAIFVRYLKDAGETIQTLSASLKKSVATSSENLMALEGVYLPENIASLAISPSGRVFYLGTISGANGIIANADGSKPVKIFDSPLSGWLAEWPAEGTITLTTKAASGVTGFMYFLNPKTGGLTAVLSGIPGLTTLTSPDASRVLYSSANRGVIQAQIFDAKKDEGEAIGIATLSEKCVWSGDSKEIYCAVPNSLPVGTYPDHWYQGVISFSDNVWRVDGKTGSSTQIADLTSLGRVEIDAVNLALSPSEDYLFFINKEDLSLWALRLSTSTSAQ